MIEVEELTKKYGNHTAVERLSFRVEKGEIYGFLGPNGAGKSTTMNILTGYLGATSGKVVINGYDMKKEDLKAKRCIGYLPETPPLYQDMTVLEYLTFVSELKGVKRGEREEQIKKVSQMTGVEETRGRLIWNLSKGYRQRVGLAQALLGFPEIILLDEPMAGLDPKQIIEVRDLIKFLGKEHTVFLSSHILSEVSAVCDHILIISEGRLMASDTPENLSRLTQGGLALELTVRGSGKQTKNVLESIREISSFTVQELQDGECSVKIKYDRDQDVREEVFSRMAGENLPILSMQTIQMSLEDVFLELTSGSREEGGGSGLTQEQEAGIPEAEGNQAGKAKAEESTAAGQAQEGSGGEDTEKNGMEGSK